MKPRFLYLVAVLPLGACATAGGGGAAVRVDLTGARTAVEDARQAGAAERAVDPFTRAQGHLNEAEALLAGTGGDARERARQAEWLGRLAAVEARWAAEVARLANAGAVSEGAPSASAEMERATARLRKAEEDQKRLEDRVAVLQRDLELTETEVIRTKARLKGNETKAEASSAIAEARILMRRLSDERGRAASLARCQELLARAEQLLGEDNYGAAFFFALKAQDTAIKAQDAAGPAVSDTETAPPRRRYVVRAATANIRKGPSTSEPVVGRASKGDALEALSSKGDWLKVRFGGRTGWIHRMLVE